MSSNGIIGNDADVLEACSSMLEEQYTSYWNTKFLTQIECFSNLWLCLIMTRYQYHGVLIEYDALRL
jgi:hypothetical protein